MKSPAKKKPFAFWIFVGLLAGILIGLVLIPVHIGTVSGLNIAVGYIKPLGTIFLNLLRFVVVPIVLFSIASGVISMRDIRKVGSIGGKTIVFYVCTTAFALVIGLILASIAKSFGMFRPLRTSGLEFTAPEGPSLMDTLVDIFPANPILPLANATMLQVIVIALFLGFGVLLAGKKGEIAGNVVESLNEVFLKIMDMIIKLSPLGVACLICPVITENGPQILGDLFIVLVIAYIGYALHAAIVYSLTVKVLGGVSPVVFFKEMAPAMIMAFSSASSMGTLPFTLECSEKLGAKKEIASFVLPLGATINMDGTAIYQGVCAVFIASCYGIDLSIGHMLTIVLTATLASIGTAGVPGAGMVMLTMVLQSVNIPIEGIALVAGIDRLFDMGRTTVNITGDAACAVIISSMENRKSKKL